MFADKINGIKFPKESIVGFIKVNGLASIIDHFCFIKGGDLAFSRGRWNPLSGDSTVCPISTVIDAYREAKTT